MNSRPKPYFLCEIMTDVTAKTNKADPVSPLLRHHPPALPIECSPAVLSTSPSFSSCLHSPPGTRGCAGLEAVLEPAGDGAEVPHAAGAGRLSALSLLGPVVCLFPKLVSQTFQLHVALVARHSFLLESSSKWNILLEIIGKAYICGSWQPGIRTRRTAWSGCGGSGDHTGGRGRGSCCACDNCENGFLMSSWGRRGSYTFYQNSRFPSLFGR